MVKFFLICAVVICLAKGDEPDDISFESEVLDPYDEPIVKHDKIDTNSNEHGVSRRRRVAGDDASRWPNGRVPYIITNPQNSEKHNKGIHGAIEQFHKHTCIKFVEKTDEDKDFLNFLVGTDGNCQSLVGKVGGGQVMNLGEGCEQRPTVIHEIMHAIGFDHEHSRADRDKYVTVNLENCQESAKSQYDLNPTAQLFHFKYDHNSIMHYASTEFGIEDGPDKTPRQIMSRKDGKPMVNNDKGFSKYDAEKVNTFYKNCQA